MIVITDQRFLGSFGVKVFSTDKLDIPLRSVDSFGVDDSLFGNIFGYTRVKMLSRASTHFFRWITRDSCQTIKNAYYDWGREAVIITATEHGLTGYSIATKTAWLTTVSPPKHDLVK